MNEGLVSIIIPCYNGEEFLEQTLKSVLWQTYSNWECIFVDDGSTDGSPQIFRSFADRDSRFKYFRQENKGLAAARNTGIDIAEGEFIQFLDDDDLLLNHRLEVCVNRFKEEPNTDVLYSDYMCYSAGLGFVRPLPVTIPHRDVLYSFLFQFDIVFIIPVHSFFFKEDIIKKHKFDTTLHSYAEDVECWIRIAAERATRFSYIDEVLSIYRFTSNTLVTNAAKLYSARVDILQRYAKNPQCIIYREDFDKTISYFKQRLVIAYFMEKSFSNGWRMLIEQWKYAQQKSRVKMLVWFFLMLLFSKKTIKRIRTSIIHHTPAKRIVFSDWKEWNPPDAIRKLISE